MLEGLDIISANSKDSLNKENMNKLISNLGKRVFILHNVHAKDPIIFQTRWAMSYLRGPMTKNEIKLVMKDRYHEIKFSPTITKAYIGASSDKFTLTPPTISRDIQQIFLPVVKNAALSIQEIKTNIKVNCSLKSLPLFIVQE